MKTETKNKRFFWVAIISCCIFVFVVGYSAGYHEAAEVYDDRLERCIGAIIECNDGYGQCVNLVEEYEVTLAECVEQLTGGEELLEKGYNNGWWDANHSKRCKIEKMDGVWFCHTENCTEEQISAFIEKDYYNGYHYTYTYYDDFDGCYIRSVGAKK